MLFTSIFHMQISVTDQELAICCKLFTWSRIRQLLTRFFGGYNLQIVLT
jgi:hypothetical protein